MLPHTNTTGSPPDLNGRKLPFFLPSGHSSLVDKVMDSFPACHEFEPNTSEDPPSRGNRCLLNMLRLKRLPIDVGWKLGKEDTSSRAILVT
ncbi:hypothetical protein TNCV_4112571 [Trichonephila clavipes]|nr:hypothetical protein TNCV_4112571 [Trichonephila clavipes]